MPSDLFDKEILNRENNKKKLRIGETIFDGFRRTQDLC